MMENIYEIKLKPCEVIVFWGEFYCVSIRNENIIQQIDWMKKIEKILRQAQNDKEILLWLYF